MKKDQLPPCALLTSRRVPEFPVSTNDLFPLEEVDLRPEALPADFSFDDLFILTATRPAQKLPHLSSTSSLSPFSPSSSSASTASTSIATPSAINNSTTTFENYDSNDLDFDFIFVDHEDVPDQASLLDTTTLQPTTTTASTNNKSVKAEPVDDDHKYQVESQTMSSPHHSHPEEDEEGEEDEDGDSDMDDDSMLNSDGEDDKARDNNEELDSDDGSSSDYEGPSGRAPKRSSSSSGRRSTSKSSSGAAAPKRRRSRKGGIEKKRPGRKPQPVDEETRRMKRKMRQEKNRMAARKCREKKQSYFKDLEVEVIGLRKGRDTMVTEISLLKEEILFLRSKLSSSGRR